MADDVVSDEVRAHLARMGVQAGALAEPLDQHAGIQALIGLVESSWTLSEAASALDTTAEDVAARAARGDLYAVPLGAELRVPAWQVLGGQPLPGLPTLLAGLPEGLHPVALERLMTTPADAFDGMNPVEWMATAGPVAPVLARARSLAPTGTRGEGSSDRRIGVGRGR